MKKAKAWLFAARLKDNEFWATTAKLYEVMHPYAVATGMYYDCI